MFRLYGTVAVVVDGIERSVGGKLERGVLAFLATRPNGTVAADALIDAFWTSDPERARKSLHVRVSNLRRVLRGSGAEIDHVPDGYRLVVDEDSVDTLRYERLVIEARGLGPQESLTVLDRARRLRTEPPLAEFTYDDFARQLIRRDHELSLETAILSARAKLRLGQASQAVTALAPIAQSEPVHEGLAETLMRCCAAAGRTAEALRVFRTLSDALAERGLAPSVRVRRLEESILLGRVNDDAGARLPSRPALLGRDRDLTLLVDLLREQRFVTVVGAPGVGKTSLALAACHDLARRREVRSIWVELGPVTPGEVLRHLLGVANPAEGGEDVATLAGALRTPAMLVLDNCEHVVAEVDHIVTNLLGVVEDLTVLVTSRVAFGDSQRLPLEPLATPSPGAISDEVTSSPSVLLFARTAVARDPSFELRAHLDSVAELCRSLDGVPPGSGVGCRPHAGPHSPADTQSAGRPPRAAVRSIRLPPRTPTRPAGNGAVVDRHAVPISRPPATGRPVGLSRRVRARRSHGRQPTRAGGVA